jgi:hypothetical protein
MLFTGPELTYVLRRSDNEIELRNEFGRCCRLLSRDQAVSLDPDLFVGIGNLRRIRFLRPRVAIASLNAGSRSTRRLKDDSGQNIAHPLIIEHRSIPGRGE